jgi:transcriptional regulator with XRE-family HTH domain
MKLGKQILQRRRTLNWTQAALAQKTGKSQSAISRIETDEQALLPDEIERFARALETSVDDLIGAPPVAVPTTAGVGDLIKNAASAPFWSPTSVYDPEVRMLHDITQSLYTRMNALVHQVHLLHEQVDMLKQKLA